MAEDGDQPAEEFTHQPLDSRVDNRTLEYAAEAYFCGRDGRAHFDCKLWPLPFVDAHCHIIGRSAVGNNFTPQDVKEVFKQIMDPVDQIVVKELLRYVNWKELDMARLAAQGLMAERDNAQEVLAGPSRLTRSTRSRAVAVPLHLDFGYTPIVGAVGTALNVLHSVHYATPQVATESEIDGNPENWYYCPSERYTWYRRDTKSFTDTIQAHATVALELKGEVFPFVAFDPRRPDALKYVQEAIGKQGFVGIKLYSRWGWMPWNNGEIHGLQKGKLLDGRLDALYQYAVAEQLPMLNHTSPTGYPPEDALVLPARYHDKDRRSCPLLSGKPDFPPMLPNGFQTKSVADCVLKGCVDAAQYCHYIQKTTSPYAWDEVLKRKEFSPLRLNLAHSGSDLGVFCRYYPQMAARFHEDPSGSVFDIKSAKLTGVCTRLRANPMVARGADFRHDGFAHCCTLRAAVIYGQNMQTIRASESARQGPRPSREGTLKEYDYESIKSGVQALLKTEPWAGWLERWAEAYPYDWTSKTILLQAGHDNVYSDIAYLSGETREVFEALLAELAADARSGLSKEAARPQQSERPVRTDAGGAMLYKHMIGTDWYMTKMDHISPQEFWRRVSDIVPLSDRLWPYWAQENAFRFLNLGRLDGKGFGALEEFYERNNGRRLPEWWLTLKEFYL
jgi:hypothetical protein